MNFRGLGTVVRRIRLGATQFGVPNDIGWRGSERIHANPATFSLELGCYYTDVHLLPWTGSAPDRPRCPRGQGPRYPTCHRLRSLARSYEYANVQGTLFPSAHDGSDLHRALDDALRALRLRGISWLESTHDIDAYLARRDEEPSESMERNKGNLEPTEEEALEIKKWVEENGIDSGEPFALYGSVDAPRFYLRMQLEANLRDHTAADPTAPSGDLLYGLFVGEGRAQEAVEAMRQDSTTDESRYAEMLALGMPGASMRAMRKHEKAHQQQLRDHLAMLERSLRGEAAY